MDTVADTVALPTLDENGLLFDPHRWNETVAERLASMVGIDELSDDHWLIIYTLRSYYTKFGVAPSINNICRDYQKDKNWVHDLFGSCLNAWCVAGLPDPGEEAKTYLNDM